MLSFSCHPIFFFLACFYLAFYFGLLSDVTVWLLFPKMAMFMCLIDYRTFSKQH